MDSGAYVALSGLRMRLEQLDRLAADIANAGTAGYKAERTTAVTAERAGFEGILQSAVDVTPGPGHIDFRAGVVEPTGRDLDLAIEGRGFFALETPNGTRYTRNGHFARRADGILANQEGFPVLGRDGRLQLGEGALEVDADGTIKAGGRLIGQLRIVDFDNEAALAREEGSRFRAPGPVTPVPAADAQVRAGALEKSNVSVVERLAHLVEVSRSFEALQRGVTVLMNDVDARAIAELGRR